MKNATEPDRLKEARTLLTRILKTMKSDQKDDDRYVYEEEKAIKEFLDATKPQHS